MKLQTPVTDEKCKVGISYENKILLLGSCFSDNIGSRLADYGFNVLVNPFGTIYNPLSILQSIYRLQNRLPFNSEDCVRIGAGDDRICSFHHHTSFARESNESFVDNANAALAEAARFYDGCDRIIITLGTSWCFRHLERDIIVSNCLKRDAKEFRREFLTVEQTASALEEIIRISSTTGCRKEIIFTVSPIRHFKDGAHGNQLSKSSLLLGIDRAISAAGTSGCDYFPAYEIMMDELRDYRFYAEDMNHPSIQAVNYIGERFLQWSLPAQERTLLEENIRKARKNSHIEKTLHYHKI